MIFGKKKRQLNFLASLPRATRAPVNGSQVTRVIGIAAIGIAALALAPKPTVKTPTQKPPVNLINKSGDDSAKLDRLEAKLRERLQVSSSFKNVKISREKSAIQITIQSDSIFKTGSADLQPKSEPGFREFALWLAVLDAGKEGMDIQIESHTDRSPVVKHRNLFRSNWELSAARAATITSFFEQSKVPMSHLQAIAFADSRPLGDDPALNRRIVIRLSSEKSGS